MATGNGYKPERRKQQRRVKNERRDTIRWEPGKEDRRKESGRRSGDMLPRNKR
jgi:hypothetical protein